MAASIQSVAVQLAELAPRQPAAATVEFFQTLADRVRAGIGDRSLGDQSPAKWDLAGQLAGDGPPAERAGGNRQDFGFLMLEADLAAAGGGD